VAVEARVVTDPLCAWSWGTEPKLRRLRWELGDELELRWVMGGMNRNVDAGDRERYLSTWLEVARESGMPLDPALWSAGGISSSYPACQAVVAACEQGSEAGGRYLRRLREGVMCERKRLDHPDALIAEAGAAGLDVPRFEIDLRSNAIVERFGAHLEEARRIPEQAKAEDATGCTGPIERVTFPSLTFVRPGGERHGVYGWQPYEHYVEAATAAGARPTEGEPPSPLEVIERLGRSATAEMVEVTGRPRVVVEAELWGLARDWRVKATPVLTGTLWEMM
jgi:protein-disulfide isomerase-like protein with CxxC motif